MKIITRLFLAFVVLMSFLTDRIEAQTADQYTFTATTGSFSQIFGVSGATTAATNSDCGVYTAITLPFTFTFEGVNYTQVRPGSDGWLSFVATATCSGSNNLATTTGRRPLLAPLWDDLDGNATGSVSKASYLTTGTAPNRVFTYEWLKWEWNWGSSSPVISFQVKLYETTNEIEYIYQQESGAVASGSASIGLCGATSGKYLSLNGTGSSPTASSTTETTNLNTKPATGQIYKFTPPPPCTGTPIAGTVSPALLNVCPTVAPAPLTVSGYSTGVTGITFQWQESSNGTDYTNVTGGTGATTTTYTPPAFAGTLIYYRCAVSCTASGQTAYSTAATIDAPASPVTQVSNISFSSVTKTGMTINWTNGNGGRRFVKVNTMNSFTDPVSGSTGPGTANTVYAGGEQVVYDGTGTSVTISGLVCNTAYYVRVYEYLQCTSGGTTYYYNTNTATNNPNNQTTSATPAGTLPEVIPFTGFTGSNLSTVFPKWSEGTGATAPTGTTSGWTSSTSIVSGGTTAKINLYSNTKNDWILGPAIPLTGDSRVRFKAAITDFAGSGADPSGMQGTDDKVRVMISTDGCGTTWTNLFTFEASNTVTLTNVLTEFIVVIPNSYNGQTVQIAFYGTEGTTDDTPDYDFHIDDVNIELLPACEAPGSISVSGVTSSDAVLSWTASVSNPADGYEWKVTTTNDPNASAVASGSTAAGVINANASGLSPNTVYYAHVRAICSGSSQSAWTSSSSFTTSCAPVAFPLNEQFDAAGLPSCWTRSLISGSTNWNGIVGSSGDISGPHSGAGFMEKDYNTSDALLYSAPIDFTSVSGIAQVNCFLHRHASAHANDRYRIFVNTTASLTGATQILELFSLTTTAPTVSGTGWYNYTSPIPNSFNGNPAVYIIIQGTTTAGFSSYDLGVDNFKVELAPNCLPPTLPVVSGITANSATLSWTASTSNPANGYEWKVTTTNDPNASAVANGNTAAGITTATASGLSSGTAYYFHVRSDCGGSDYSTWVSSAFTTLFGCPGNLGAGNVTINSLPYFGTALTNNGAGNDITGTNAITCGSTNYFGGEDRVFIFTPSFTGDYNILLTTGTDDDAGIMLYDGCPFTGSGSTCIAQVQATTGLTRTMSPTLTQGVTYYLVVDNWISPAYINSYDLSITMKNDECSGAININGGGITGVPTGTPMASSTVDASASAQTNTCGGDADDDVWFVFTTDLVADAIITVTPNGSFSPVIQAFTGTCSGLTHVDCAVQANVLTIPSAPASTTYYVRVYDFGTGLMNEDVEERSAGGFTIEYGLSPVPVELSSFKGVNLPTHNLLEWVTYTESNVASHVIERSPNGHSNWTVVGKVSGKGNSQTEQHYALEDRNPFATTYYRLRTVDFDATEQLSKVILVTRKDGHFGIVSAFPNPAETSISLQLNTNEEKTITVRVTDVAGRLVQQQQTGTVKGVNQLPLDIKTLSAGTYFIYLVDELQVSEPVRFIKK